MTYIYYYINILNNFIADIDADYSPVVKLAEAGVVGHALKFEVI